MLGKLPLVSTELSIVTLIKYLNWLVVVWVLTSCTTTVEQLPPEAVVQKVFEVAASKNYDQLQGLCAPEADQGIQRICDLSDAKAEDQERFSEVVSQGSIGKPEVNGDKATVSLHDKNGKADGKVFLVKKEGQWYMVGGE